MHLRFLLALICLGSSCGTPSSLDPDSADVLTRARWERSQLGGVSAEVLVGSGAPADGLGRPALLILHGCAQSADDLVDRTDLASMADAFGAVVVVPDVPNGGVYAGCWDYYGSSHSRSVGQPAALLGLVDAVLDDPALDVHPDRVWISGLSSGGGMAAVMGCLAPDVFAGVGLAAAPAVGTTAFQISSVSTTADRAAGVCRTLAGSRAASFDTQLAGVVAGTLDYIVAQGYADVDVGMLADLYQGDGAALVARSADVTALRGYQPDGVGTIYAQGSDDRIFQISAQGMGHAWPAGTGAGPELRFVASEGVDFAWALAEFFSSNALRTEPFGDVDPDDGTPTEPDPEPEDSGVPPDGDCDPWVDSDVTTISGHIPRYQLYPAGWGAADATYVALLNQHGVTRTFPLYESEGGDWYADPDNVPPRDCP
ncbi:MAG: PHB depolymerase family esterase [Myxococcales bacterium]|nr:PHB depolymerase family esterase [Myxococcales bacterium]